MGRPRSVVVTGAGRGIGRATALALQQDGWLVVGVDKDREAVARLDTTLSRGAAISGDVTDDAVLHTARERAEALGVLTGWVNNAGHDVAAPLDRLERTRIDASIALNLVAQLIGCQEAVRSFLASETAGAIVNMSSIHARASFPGLPIYEASKAGVEALTRYVCVEYGARGIRCNAVAPGAVMTEGVEEQIAAADDPSLAREQTLSLSPMHRAARPEEIADTIAFLLSERASSINGHVLVVDSGATARCAPGAPDGRPHGSWESRPA